MTLSAAITTTTALTTATTGAIARAINQPKLSSVATRIPMPSARIRKGARELAKYLPAYPRMDSKHADKTTVNDLDMDFELLAEVDSDDEAEIIHLDDGEEEQDEWSEDSWSSDETSDASDEEPLETDWDLTAFDQAPATKGKSTQDDLPASRIRTDILWQIFPTFSRPPSTIPSSLTLPAASLTGPTSKYADSAACPTRSGAFFSTSASPTTAPVTAPSPCGGSAIWPTWTCGP